MFSLELDLPQLLRHKEVETGFLLLVPFLYAFELRIRHPAAELTNNGLDLRPGDILDSVWPELGSTIWTKTIPVITSVKSLFLLPVCFYRLSGCFEHVEVRHHGIV
ncbi:hypothetical protein D3C81_1501030 [compost metagenome]